MKYKVNVIYSIGIRCYTQIFLKNLSLINFSSIFGSLNIKNLDNIIKCFDSNFDALLNKKNLIFTKNYKQFENLNKTYGNRTLNNVFDNINNYHDATIAHHDLSLENHYEHFNRGLKRLNFIKNNNIPILFVNISHFTEFNNSQINHELTNSIKNFGFNNFKILSIYITNKSNKKIKLLYQNKYNIIYQVQSIKEYKNFNVDIINYILNKHFKFNKLLSIYNIQIS